MAFYEYRCEHDGTFDVTLPIGTAPAAIACPTCMGDAERVFTNPMVKLAPRDARIESVFACRGLKPLTAEQLFDSLTAALDARELQNRRGMFLRSFVGRSLGEDFSNVWRYRETVQDLMTKLTLDLQAP